MREYPSHFITFMNYNADPSNAFANQKLRQAVSMAIDKKALLDGAYSGHGGVAKTLGASSCADFKKEWLSEDYYDYNPAKAKKLLADAGYASKPLKIRLLVDNFASRVRIAQIIQSNLAAIGVTVDILSYDTALYNTYKYTADQWDMYIETLNCDDYVTTIWDSALNNTKYKDGGTMGHYKDAKLQEYVLAAGSKQTRTDVVVNEARKYIYEKVPSFGLIYTSVSHASMNAIMDMTVNMSCYVQPGAFTYSVDFGKKR
jgi:ABC-type transport system substrate-binding protein